VKLAPDHRPLPAGSSPISGPLAPDQFPMPAEQGLRSRQERSPVRPGQDPAERSQHEAIGGLPARPASLALQHRELVAKGQDLGPKPGLGPAAHDQGLQQETDYRVEEGVQHDRGSIAGPDGGSCEPPLQGLEQKGCGPDEGLRSVNSDRRHTQFRTDSAAVNHTGRSGGCCRRRARSRCGGGRGHAAWPR